MRSRRWRPKIPEPGKQGLELCPFVVRLLIPAPETCQDRQQFFLGKIEVSAVWRVTRHTCEDPSMLRTNIFLYSRSKTANTDIIQKNLCFQPLKLSVNILGLSNLMMSDQEGMYVVGWPASRRKAKRQRRRGFLEWGERGLARGDGSFALRGLRIANKSFPRGSLVRLHAWLTLASARYGRVMDRVEA